MEPNITNQSTDSNEHIGRATQAINAVFPWVLIVFGILFNLLIVLAMRTKYFRSQSTSVFMIVGALNDVTSIPILLFAHWLHVNFPDAYTRDGSGSDFLCKFFNFYGWGQADFGILLLSAMTADRAYAILKPMTTVDLMKRAKIVTGVCVGVVIAKQFHFWFSSEMVSGERKDRLCDVAYTSAAYNTFYHHYWPWLDTAFVTLCFVVMVASNLVLVGHVRRSRKGAELQVRGEETPAKEGTSQQKRMTRSPSTMSIHAGAKYSNTGTQVTKMLLAESLSLFLLSYPFSVHLLVTSQMDDLHTDPDKAQANALAFNVVFYLLYANKCVTFLAYTIAGKKFRKAVADEVLCRFRCGQLQFGEGRGGVRRMSESGYGSFQVLSHPRKNSDAGGSRPPVRTETVLANGTLNIACVSCNVTET